MAGIEQGVAKVRTEKAGPTSHQSARHGSQTLSMWRAAISIE